jgi:predicted Rossmann-fold nucleotide-binding protein
VIAVSGGYGTLSEIALALKAGKTVIGLKSWDIPGMVKAADAEHALTILEELLS